LKSAKHYFEFPLNTILGSGAKAMPVQRFRSCLAATVKVTTSVATSNDHSARYLQALPWHPLGVDHESIGRGGRSEHRHIMT